jgi:O-antigen/teichoic acid export membrane protein
VTVRNAFYLSFASTYSALVLQFLTTIILARLLTPAQIGIFSVASVLVGVAHMVRDFGVSQYLVQEKTLSDDKLRTAFTITAIVSWTLAALLYLVRVPVSELYHEPGVASVIAVLAVNFVLIPFSSTVMAVLQRDLKFAELFWIKIASEVVYAITVVALAAQDFAYMSAAWSSLAGIVTTVVVTNFYRPKGFPFLPGVRQFRSVLSFSGLITAGAVASEIGRAAPDLIIGKFQSMEAVGFFGRAAGLIEIFNRVVMRALWPVMLPYFSGQARDGGDLKASYAWAMSCLSGVAWPFFGFVALMAYPIVRILYGDQWDASVPLVKVFCLSGMLLVPIYPAGQILVALGMARTTMQLQFVLLAFKVLLLLAAVQLGLIWSAVALALWALLASLTYSRLMARYVAFGVGDVFRACCKSGEVTLLSLMAPTLVLVTMSIGPNNLWAPVALAGLGAGIGWTIGIYALHHPIHAEVSTILNGIKNRVRVRLAKQSEP